MRQSKKIILFLVSIMLFLGFSTKQEKGEINNQDSIRTSSTVVEEQRDPKDYHEYLIKITDLSSDDATKFSLSVHENGQLVQTLETPADMDDILPFDRRFFTVEDVNFDGYEDLYFTDYMGMVNASKIVFQYNPDSLKFELNEDYRSIISPEFDVNNQIIKSFSRGSAAHYELETYTVLDNKLTRISRSVEDRMNNIYNYSVYDGKEEVDVNESLRKAEQNVAFFKTTKFNILIDLLENNKYRYASWGASKGLRNHPDLSLSNGTREESENEISYKFKNGAFTYVCGFNKTSNKSYLAVFQKEKEILHQEATVFLMPNQLKVYEGNKTKVTLEIVNK